MKLSLGISFLFKNQHALWRITKTLTKAVFSPLCSFVPKWAYIALAPSTVKGLCLWNKHKCISRIYFSFPSASQSPILNHYPTNLLGSCTVCGKILWTQLQQSKLFPVLEGLQVIEKIMSKSNIDKLLSLDFILCSLCE